jgi:tRNA threonylcarbamoyladenosine biosynthesis protein TsaE
MRGVDQTKEDTLTTLEMRSWKKVFENDLPYVVSELKESINHPAMIILTGEMGTGKTTFARSFSKNEKLQSPTYAILAETKTILHADFYRIQTPDEIIHLELAPALEGKEYFLVEWGKKYLRDLFRVLDEKFTAYELTITANSHTGDKTSRNYTLEKLSSPFE